MCKNRIISIIAVFLVSVLVLAFIATADWSGVVARAQYKRDYTALSTEELDDLSYRTSVSDELPQMTVFVHGLGGMASHWASNDQYIFGYEASSMPETLRNYVNILNGENSAEIIAVKPSYELKNSSGALKSKAEAQSKVLEQTTDAGKGNGAVELRGIYEKYKPDTSNQNPNEDEAETESNDWGIEIYDCNINDYPILREKDAQKGQTKDNPDRYALIESDVTKHIIVIFEQWQGEIRGGNDFVYSQFEYCMDALSYQYAQLTGELPTVNLIAHSRGGITAMQYALAHPYNVASIYTMGAPFNGSDFGSIEINGEHPLLSLATYKPDYQYKDGQDYAPGILDILNSELSESYKKFWNDHYEEYYSHIQFKPIGSYVDIIFLVNVLDDWLQRSNITSQPVGEVVLGLVASFVALDFPSHPFFVLKTFAITAAIINLFDVLEVITRNTEIYPVIKALSNVGVFTTSYEHIGKHSFGLFVLEDDMFIDLDSQVAAGYKGADRRVKLFKSDDFEGKRSLNNVGVAHNLETHNQDIIDYIVHGLNFGASEGIFSARYTADGCYITNLNNAAAQGELVIPETYNGYTVIGIDGLTRDLDMSGSQTYHTGITSVKIPSTVKYIGDYAFYGMSNLQSVTYAGQNNIDEIGYFAFGNCASLTSFEIGAKVEFIGQGAFGGCDSLTSFSLQAGNSTFLCNDGVLYSGGGAALNAFPAGRGGEFTVPESVNLISSGSFYGNEKLTAVNLNQAHSVSDYAFADCTNLSEITAPNLRSAGVSAFENTHWLNNASDEFVSLGSVLIKYQGDDTVLHLSDYEHISAFAFANCTNLEEVDFEGDALNYIGSMAFSGCTNLEKVTIRNSGRLVSASAPIFDADSACIVDVPSKYIEEYKADASWAIYKDQIKDLLVTIQFVDGGVVQEYTKETKYWETLTDMPVPQKEGYEFLGWYKTPNAEGQKYEDGFINIDTSDFTLYANWRAIPYAVLYDMDGGTNHAENPREYTVEQTVTLQAPTKTGYTFIGWELDGVMLDGNQISGKTGDLHLKAIWEAKSIAVGFDSKGSANYPASSVGLTHVTYGTDDFCFDIPERVGFKFLGWYYNEIAFTDANGNAVRKWDLPENTILYAVWEAESFKIRYDYDTGSIYFSGSAWTDEEVEVTVGMQLANENVLEETFQQYYKIQHKIIKYFYYLKPNGERVTFKLSNAYMPFLEAINGTVEFFAEYRQEVHTVILVTNVLGQNFPSIQADSGSSIVSELNTRIPVRKGYTFGGWKITVAPDNTALVGTVLGNNMPDCSSEQIDSNCKAEAIWTPISVTIELDPNGGSSVSSYQAVFGEEFNLPVPERLGYSFVGWYDTKNKQYTSSKGESLETLEETELELVAHWNIIYYSITYDLDGGQNVSSNPETYTVNSVITLSAPQRNGFRFGGWYTDSNYKNKITQIKGTGNLTLYAKWIALFKINILDNGIVIDTFTGVYDEEITLPTYSRTGYDGKLRDNLDGRYYNFGDRYVVRTNTEIVVSWTSNDLHGSFTVRTKQVTITDNGRWTNHKDAVDLTRFTGGLSISELKSRGYKKLKFKISLDISEEKDGYQYVMIYDSDNESIATEIVGVTIEHGPGKEDNNFKTYSYDFVININDIKSDYIYILYGASGFGNDDWNNKNVKVEGTFTKIS